jgi:hypothetical protein
MPNDTAPPSVLEVPSYPHDVTSTSRRSTRRVSFSPGIRLRRLRRSCPLGYTWSVMRLAVVADAGGVVLGRVVSAPVISWVTFMVVASAVLAHACRQH